MPFKKKAKIDMFKPESSDDSNSEDELSNLKFRAKASYQGAAMIDKLKEDDYGKEIYESFKNDDKPYLKAPFIMIVLAPTGTGKTYCTSTFLSDIHKGIIHLRSRFETKKVKEGDPVKFRKIIYLGQTTNSIDQNHNSKIAALIESAEEGGIAYSIMDLQKKKMAALGLPYSLASEIPAASYGNLMVDFIESHMKLGNCVIIDDMSAMIESLGKENRQKFIDFFKVGSHHNGGSLIVLLQKMPPKGIGQEMVMGAHYYMFPQPVHTPGAVGVNAGDIDSLMRSVVGKSAIWRTRLRAFSRLGTGKDSIKPPPGQSPIPAANYILWNRIIMLCDHQLKKQGKLNMKNKKT